MDAPRNSRKPDPDTPIGAALLSMDRSYAWLGRQVGVSRMAIWFWTRGSQPSDEIKATVAALLGRPVGELWPGEITEEAA